MRRVKLGERVQVTQPDCRRTKECGDLVAFVLEQALVVFDDGVSDYIDRRWLVRAEERKPR